MRDSNKLSVRSPAYLKCDACQLFVTSSDLKNSVFVKASKLEHKIPTQKLH